MSVSLGHLVEHVRATQGSFFLARVAMKVPFRLDKPSAEPEEAEKQVEDFVRVCRSQGYDPLPKAQ